MESSFNSGKHENWGRPLGSMVSLKRCLPLVVST